MTSRMIESLYRGHIRNMPPAEQLELITLISAGLAKRSAPRRRRTLLELEGLGAEIWQGADAQEYVDRLRNEWDRPER